MGPNAFLLTFHLDKHGGRRGGGFLRVDCDESDLDGLAQRHHDVSNVVGAAADASVLQLRPMPHSDVVHCTLLVLVYGWAYCLLCLECGYHTYVNQGPVRCSWDQRERVHTT